MQYIKQLIGWVALAAVVGCSSPQPDMPANNSRYNDSVMTAIKQSLMSGDVVLRCGRGAQSYLFANLNAKDKRYSHCGIAMVWQGKPYIYHCIGGEDNPTQTMRCDPIDSFLKPNYNSAAAVVHYALTDNQRQAVIYLTDSIYRQKPFFDLDFSLATADKLYCSELAYRVLNAATACDTFIHTTTAYNRQFVGIDNLFLNRHATFVCNAVFK